MTRITKTLVNQIANKAAEKAGFPAKFEAIQLELYELAERFRIESLGGPEEAVRIEKVLKQMEALSKTVPDNILSTQKFGQRSDDMWRMNLGGLRVNLPFSEDTSHTRVAPHQASFPGDHPLVLQWHEIDGRETDLSTAERDLKVQVSAAVEAFTTVKKLLEAWPEAKELLPEQVEEARPQLPALRTAELNALVGLPSEEV